MSINFPLYVTTSTTTATGDLTITNVVLQLHGDGVNGATNTGTFLDASTNTFTISRAGTPAQGSVNPFGSNWSAYFNGSTDYLSLSEILLCTVSNFTIECWVYMTGSSASQNTIVGTRGASAAGWELRISTSNIVQFYFTGISPTLTSSAAISLNTWAHVAVVRNAGTVTIYLNGVAGSGSSISNGTNSGNPTVIGNELGSAGNYFQGYISNFRIINGTALYTSTFTPSTTPLTTVSNTVLLTAATNRIQDTSTASNAITVAGSLSVQRFSPFAATQTTVYSTGTYSGSVYFNGSTDYLSFSGITFGTNAYTIEFWFYSTSFSTYWGTLSTGNVNALSVRIINTTTIAVDQFGVSASNFTVPTMNPNTWNHVVAVRNLSNATTIFLNGIRSSSGAVTMSNNYSGSTNNVGLVSSNYFPGYISNMRAINGASIYDPTQTTITVPTQPLTAVTSTSLLLLGSNAGIVDTTMQNTLITVGSAQISTSIVKYGSSSMKFNGSTDYLTIPTTPNLYIGTGTYTVEAWIYMNNTTGNQMLFTFGNNNGYFFASGIPTYTVFSVANYTLGSTAVSATTWTHVAFVRNGTTLTCYLNGVSVGTYSPSSESVGSSSANSYVSFYQGSNYFNGYIDDLRITKGVARYTATFTPPTSANPDTTSITVSTTTYTTSFTTSGQVTTSSLVSTSTGGVYYTTSTGLFTGTSVVHIFTATGTSYFTASQSVTVSYLVVAGGGGGGGNGPGSGGGAGGGGGGMVTGTALLSAGTTYTITVGTGGTGGPISAPSTSGGFSSITSGTTVISTATGGGAGGGTLSTGQVTGQPGGSGGGGNAGSAGGTATQPSQTHPGSLTYQNFGNPGGSGQPGSLGASGGGGGAGAAGSPGNATGGAGTSSYITGSLQYYAGGGGGWNSPSVGSPGGLGGGGPASVAGTPNTGGGGGGGGIVGLNSGTNGGPGIVVISYARSTATVTTVLYTANTTTYTYNTVSSRWVVHTPPTSTATNVITPVLLSNQNNAATGFFALSSGTTAQRPAVTTSTLYYTAGTGGNTYTTSTGLFSGTSVVHVFTATGISYFTATSSATVAYLAVGGGGGGGAGRSNCLNSRGGAGGAGGFITGTFTASAGTTYTVTVGSGGAGTGAIFQSGTPGGFSSITSGTTVVTTSTGGTGGLGGAPPCATTPGYLSLSGGISGAAPQAGSAGGGGGGAGGNGVAGPAGGAGGAGTSTNISGTVTSYAGGGGGTASGGTGFPGGSGGGGQSGVAGTRCASPGTPGTGGGGGAGASGNPIGPGGGTGGPGIVVISYQSTPTLTPVTSIQLPVGALRYNNDTNILETTNGTLWQGVGITITYPVEYLIVGGGGGGGRYGGGGAGGMLNASTNVAPGSSYTVTVGAGGTGANVGQGTRGSTSSFTGTNIIGIYACGGGGGGCSGPSSTPSTIGVPGGSGGGGGNICNGPAQAGGVGILGQGNPGGTGIGSPGVGYSGGGGGGAGSAGTNATNTVSGPGGIGLASSINGTITYYAGGGGGGQYINANTAGVGGLGGGGSGAKYNSATPISVAGSAGTAYTGGGGGGGYPGGSGIAIIRYPGSQRATGGSTVTTITVSGSPFTVHTFTATGAFIA